VRALILTAGLGTRLRPLTYVRAKAAVPVNGRPIVSRVIEWLGTHAVTDLVLNLHHHPASIAAVVGDGRHLGARVRYSWENPVLGSAGGPRHALPLLVDGRSPAEPFLLVNGDTLTDFPLAGMLDTHRQAGAGVTMALTRNPRPDVYGGVLIERGRVTGFTGRGAARESFHFVGVQLADARVFAGLEDGVAAETVMQLYPQLISGGEVIAAYVVDAPFSDVGTPADYLQASLDLAAREGNRLVGTCGVTIDPSAELNRTAVWDGVTIGANARLDECIVCDRAQVPAGASYRRCAIVGAAGLTPRDGERVDGALLLKQF
jgi:NDP-sugar pyrophosphorylase family protein